MSATAAPVPALAAVSAVAARGVTVGYGNDVLLHDLNFDVARGEVFILLGGSGCGKSTLLKHLIGLYRPIAGEIRIEGDDLATAEGSDRLRILRRFGVMYQSGALFGSMTVLENVLLPLDEFTRLPADAKRQIALFKLGLVGLADAAEKRPAELSGGMQKRAAIARAMALDPGILFLDEPSAGLDPVTSAELDVLIRSLSRDLGITFVVVTHELASVYAIGDRAVMLDRSVRGILAEGDPRVLRDTATDPRVRRFFNREPEPA